MNFKQHANGRISFPGVVRYQIRHEDWTETVPFPPTCESHPAPSTPVPLASRHTAKMIALGEIKPLPNSLPFRIEVLDLVAYERLARTGLLYDPRHTGGSTTPAIDNRSTA